MARGDDTPVRRERWSPHFDAAEFASRGREFSGGGRAAYRALTVRALEPIRIHVGRPVIINCGERKPDHNAAVGGAASSRHLPAADRGAASRDGVAVDFHVPGYTARQTWDLYRWIVARAEALGIGGAEFYPTSNFIHIDSRGGGALATWAGDSGRSAWEHSEGIA